MLSALTNKMWKKGLIVVAVPLLFEVLFVGLLFKIYQQIDLDLAGEKKAKEVIEHVQNLRDYCERAAESLAKYKSSEEQKVLDSYDQLAHAIPAELQAKKD